VTFDVEIQVVGAADGSIQILMTRCQSSTAQTCGEGTTAPWGQATLTQASATRFYNRNVYFSQDLAYPEPGGVQVDLVTSGATQSLQFNGHGWTCVVGYSGSASTSSTSCEGSLTEQ
jgi:hypothetical protein